MSNFNINSLTLAVNVTIGDNAAVRQNLTDALTYALETRFMSGRDTAYENGKLAALNAAGQKVTKDNRKQVTIAVALKAGFYALPSVLENHSKACIVANRESVTMAAFEFDIINPLVKSHLDTFFAAYDAALPVAKPVKSEAEQTEAKEKKDTEVKQASIAYAKDIGMVFVADLPQAPTIADYIQSASLADLQALVTLATNRIDAIKASEAEFDALVAERKHAELIAAQTNAQALIEAKKQNAKELKASLKKAA